MKLALLSILVTGLLFSGAHCGMTDAGTTKVGLSDTSIVKPDSALPRMQIVFALDATGSMSGLIAAAKEKIWSIASSLTQTDPAPEIEVGLIFYRDKGDAFVTLQVPLSKNLDDIYARLMEIKAAGGGDEPESVNQGLYEAVTRFTWDSVGGTYKTIFLVGDCPPHMNYKNDVQYPQSCVLAKQKDIVLNTILMGNNITAEKIWREIADCNQGSFTAVNMAANDIVISTPYDAEIAIISDVLDSSRYYYGHAAQKAMAAEKKSKSYHVAKNANVTAKAQRAEYNASTSGKLVYYGQGELLSDIKMKKILLDTMNERSLPDEIKAVPASQRKGFVTAKLQLTDSLQKKLSTLTEKRKKYIEAELDKKSGSEVETSFNSVIYEKIKTQTEKKNIKLNGKARY